MVGTRGGSVLPHLATRPDVSIGIHLSPSVLVVGGSETAASSRSMRCRTTASSPRRLPFPPIHTPRLAEYQTAFSEAIGTMTRCARRDITIYSAVLAAPMPEDPEEVEELLRTNISRPIRFWQTLHRMVDDGARFIVQIGSGTLAANSRTVLDAKTPSAWPWTSGIATR